MPVSAVVTSQVSGNKKTRESEALSQPLYLAEVNFTTSRGNYSVSSHSPTSDVFSSFLCEHCH